MNLTNTFLCVGISAIVLFLLQFIYQVRQERRGVHRAGAGRALLNWLLLFAIFGGFGGYFYTAHTNKTAAAHDEAEKTVQPKTQDDQVYVRYDKDKAHLNSDGIAKMKLIVSPETTVKIYGHRTHQLYHTFNPRKASGDVVLHYTFEYDATYDIVAKRGNKTVKKKIKIKPYEAESSSSSSSASSSSSSSSASSSSHSSSNSNSNANNSNNGGGSGNSGTGSSYSGGGGSYYRPSYGGGGGGYRAPAAPAAPSAPASAPNGTGAMH